MNEKTILPSKKILTNIPHINFTKENIGHHIDFLSILTLFFKM